MESKRNVWYVISMAENTFTSLTNPADISAYENTDLSQLNSVESIAPPTEEKLQTFLIQVVFIAKIVAWVGMIGLVLLGLYGWTRNQTQDSWLMSLPMNTAGSPLCTWMNHGYDTLLRKDSTFRDYLNANGKQSLTDMIDNGHCIAPDSIADWLKLQKTFTSQELGKTYENIIPQKFL